MSHTLVAALCLVLVLEGLFLFAAPQSWKRIAEQINQLETRHLRIIGGLIMGVGVIALQFVN